jgi:F-type H+-transporting ATPase subunit delta
VADQDQTIAGVPGRYATALYELAEQEQAVDSVGRELHSFNAMLAESGDLRRLVRSPVFAAEAQVKALEAVLDAAGIAGLTRRFILLVAHNRRLFAIGDMIKSFAALVARARGEITAEVTAAEKLSPKHLERLAAELKKVTGREVQISTRIDRSLIGGLIVKVGSRMMDASLKTKLQNLKLAMKGTG